MRISKNISTIVSTIIIILYACFPGYGVMVMNNVTDPLPPGNAKTAITQNVVLGAEHFLKGNAYALLGFSVYEKEPFDSETFKVYLNKAYTEMSLAKKYYSIAYTTVSGVALLSEKQTVSKSFDYDALCDKFSNKAIFAEVIEYFRDCNIAGIHKRNLENVDYILTTLSSITTQEKADAQTMWALFSQLSNAAQFGNYATQIAYAVFK